MIKPGMQLPAMVLGLNSVELQKRAVHFIVEFSKKVAIEVDVVAAGRM